MELSGCEAFRLNELLAKLNIVKGEYEMVKYEEKFLVINWKYLNIDLNKHNDEEVEALLDFTNALKKLHNLSLIPKENKYYVCNQDEPYSQQVIDVILAGEDAKAG